MSEPSTNNINIISILAIVGALAWLPHILTWLYSWLVKPQLKFVPENITEIGFNSLGPILNENFAIATKHKDALIEKIDLELIHESGEKHKFIWKSLDEKGFEVTDISGGRAEYSKLQSAIALKVWIMGLSEKKIFFRDFTFEKKYFELSNRLIEKQNHLKKVDINNSKQELLKSKELIDLLDFLRASFYWKEGKYTVKLYAYETSLKNPHVESFEFSLSKNDVERLEKNIELTQQETKTQIEHEGIPINEWPEKPIFNWVNPFFSKKE